MINEELKKEFDRISLLGTFGSTKAEQLLAILAKEHQAMKRVGSMLSDNRDIIKAVSMSNMSNKHKRIVLKNHKVSMIDRVRKLNLDAKLKSVLENVVRTDYKLKTNLFK